MPGYLIYLKAQINLDGVAVATSSTALQMGTTLASTGGFTKLSDPTQWDLTSETSNTVGQATAIGISAGGISAVQLTQLKDRLTTTKTQLEAKNFTGLTGEQISGDLLTATIWSCFAATESHNRLSQNQANIIENQGLTTLKPQTFACPEVGLSNVVIILSAVVFPTPLRPRNPNISSVFT